MKRRNRGRVFSLSVIVLLLQQNKKKRGTLRVGIPIRKSIENEKEKKPTGCGWKKISYYTTNRKP
jgi:hypothetical protein